MESERTTLKATKLSKEFSPMQAIAASVWNKFRRVARIFRGQGRFLRITAQILDIYERLNYMQTLQGTSFRNKYLHKLKIFWIVIQAETYNFMIKMLCFSSYNIYNNHFQNILILFDVLPNFPFITGQTMYDYYLKTWYIRVGSRVAEQRKA